MNILPCPFDGDEAFVSTQWYYERSGYNGVARVICNKCGVTMSAYTLRGPNGWIRDSENTTTVSLRAVEKWNTRV